MGFERVCLRACSFYNLKSISMKIKKADMMLLDVVINEYLKSPIKSPTVKRDGIARLAEIKLEIAGEVIPELRSSRQDKKDFGIKAAEEYFADSDQTIVLHLNP